MIKPEDVCAEMVDAVEDAIGIHASMWRHGVADAVAIILNAAIEAGIVSPPCYCVRWDGELQTHDKACPSTGLIRPRVYAGKPFSHDTEHYRGQTE